MYNTDYLLESIEDSLSWARKAQDDCITYQLQGRPSDDSPDDDVIDAELRLTVYTEQAISEVCLLAECLSLPIARADFKESLGGRETFAEIEIPFDEDSAHAPALRKTEMFFNSLKTVTGKVKAPSLEVFERILHNSAKIINDFGLNPSNETQVRNAVLKAVSYAFPDAQKEVNLPQMIKNYRGDIGVSSVSAVAEYKFADSIEAAKACLDGLYSDIKSYPINGRWRNYYAVLYLTGPFYTQHDIELAFREVRADAHWTPIVIIGPGERKVRS